MAVGLLGATLAALRLVASSTRVIGWVLAASTIAGLLYPVVARLTRWIPRAMAILVVVLVVLGAIGGITYRLVDELVQETNALRAAAPDVGKNLEASQRFGDLAKRLKLAERLPRLADDVPRRLQGGDTATALRSAATRGVAFLITGVLSLFLLLHGPRLLAAALKQVRDLDRRERMRDIALAAYRRAWIYVSGSIGMAVAAGLLAFVVARGFHVPGAAPLAVWVALWDVIPLVGAVIGALPIVVIAATLGSPGRGLAAGLILMAYAIVEIFVVQRWLERRSIRVGSFITIIAGLVGVEIYGAGGALLLEVFAVLAAATLSEVTKRREPDVTQQLALSDLLAAGDPPLVGPPTVVSEPETRVRSGG